MGLSKAHNIKPKKQLPLSFGKIIQLFNEKVSKTEREGNFNNSKLYESGIRGDCCSQ